MRIIKRQTLVDYYTKLENKKQYDEAIRRIEELYRLTDENTPLNIDASTVLGV